MRTNALKNPTVEIQLFEGEVVKPVVHILRASRTHSNVVGGTVTLKGDPDVVVGQISASNDNNAVYTLDTSLLLSENSLRVEVIMDNGDVLVQKVSAIVSP